MCGIYWHPAFRSRFSRRRHWLSRFFSCGHPDWCVGNSIGQNRYRNCEYMYAEGVPSFCKYCHRKPYPRADYAFAPMATATPTTQTVYTAMPATHMAPNSPVSPAFAPSFAPSAHSIQVHPMPVAPVMPIVFPLAAPQPIPAMSGWQVPAMGPNYLAVPQQVVANRTTPTRSVSSRNSRYSGVGTPSVPAKA